MTGGDSQVRRGQGLTWQRGAPWKTRLRNLSIKPKTENGAPVFCSQPRRKSNQGISGTCVELKRETEVLGVEAVGPEVAARGSEGLHRDPRARGSTLAPPSRRNPPGFPFPPEALTATLSATPGRPMSQHTKDEKTPLPGPPEGPLPRAPRPRAPGRPRPQDGCGARPRAPPDPLPTPLLWAERNSI